MRGVMEPEEPRSARYCTPRLHRHFGVVIGSARRIDPPTVGPMRDHEPSI
jgi:hypothetical protein